MVEEIQSRLERVRQATLPQEKRVTVFYEVYDEPLMTVGRATIIGQLLEMACGINVFADLGGRYPQVSSEEVVRRNKLYSWPYRPSTRADASPDQPAAGLELYDGCQAALYSPPQR